MDLQELKFKVDSTQVLEATNNLKKLVDALNGVSKPLADAGKGVADVNKSAGKGADGLENLGDKTERWAKSLDPVTKQLVKTQTTLDVLSGSAIEAADGTVKLGDGFTRTQAGAFAVLKILGATKAELEALAGTFTQMNTIMGVNPFDKSASGLFKLQKETQELQKVNDFLARGLNLTKSEVADLARDSVRLTSVFQQEGKSEQEVAVALKKLTDSYVQMSAEKQKAVLQAKQMEDAAKKEAQAIIDAENARKKAEQAALNAAKDIEDRRKFMFDARIKFDQEEAARFKSEKDKELKAMNDFYREQERLDQQAQKKAEAASRRTSGVSTKREEQPMDAAVKQLSKVRDQEAKNMARAADYAREAEERLANQLNNTSSAMGSVHADRALKYQRALQTMGLSADEVSVRMQAFNAKLDKVAGADRAKQLQYLSRAVSVQMGDVFTSLASGMNPFLVMIQQGDQIRGVFQQVGADSNELSRSMRGAFGQIITSIIDTGKAIGVFIVGSFIQAGKSVNSFIANITGLTASLNIMSAAAIRAGASASVVATVLGGIATVAAGITGVVVALAAALGVGLAVAYYKARDAAIDLNNQLILNGASLGLNRDMALNLARSFDGISQSKVIPIITEMAKQGGFTRDQLAMIVPIADQMKSKFGIAIEDTVKKFKDLQEKPTEGLTKLAIQLGTIPVAILKQVDALEKQHKMAEAVQLAMEAAADANQKALNNAKVFEDGWTQAAKAIKEAFNGFWNWVYGISAPKTIEEQITAIEKTISQKRKFLKPAVDSNGKQSFESAAVRTSRDAIQKEVDALSAQARSLYEVKKLREEEAAANARGSAEAKKFGDEKAKRDKEAADADRERKKVADAYADAINRVKDAKNSYLVTEKKLTDTEKLRDDLIRKLQADGVWDKLSEPKKKALDAELAATQAEEDRVRKAKEAEKALKELIKTEKERNAALHSLSLMLNNSKLSEEAYRDTLVKTEKMLDEGKISWYEYEQAVWKALNIRQSTIKDEIVDISKKVRSAIDDLTSKEKEGIRLESSGMSARDIRILNAQKENQIALESKLQEVSDKAQKEGLQDPDWLTREEEKIRSIYAERDAWIAVREEQKDALDQSDKLADAFITFFDDAILKGNDFSDTLKNLTDSIKNMIVQLLILEPLKDSMKAAFSGAGGIEGIIGSLLGTGNAAAASASFNTSALTNPVLQANGGAWDSGIQKFAKGGTFTNSVVSTPTLFKFAKGTGLMGEAGPEAIMPLTRDSAGRLGVQADSSGSNVAVVVNNYSNAQASTNETVDSRGNRRIEVTIGEMVAGEMQRSGSSTQKSVRNTFGIAPQLIRR